MYAGLDYGTSNCAIGVEVAGQVRLVPLEDGRPLIPSTLYAPSQELLNRLATHFRNLQASSFADFGFGSAATAAYLHDPTTGFYVKSPKSFLGARGISPAVQRRFTVIVTGMMQHIFSALHAHTGRSVDHVVIGRPVNFQGAGGEVDNRRALAILTDAAKACGVQEVAFLFEPMVAALELEVRQDAEKKVLVVDIGGGTTDCSFIRIGLGGIRSNGLPLPNHLFMDAVSINDVNAQQRFYSVATREQMQRYSLELAPEHSCTRLQSLRDGRGSYRFVASTENAKIRLSETDTVRVDLGYIEPGLAATLTEPQFAASSEKLLLHLRSLLEDVLLQGGVHPDLVYLTGGMARSPLARACVQAVLPQVPLVDSDHFLSVTEGLTIWSRRLFGPT